MISYVYYCCCCSFNHKHVLVFCFVYFCVYFSLSVSISPQIVTSVLKRCISGLPENECPRIPKRYLEHYRSRRVRRLINATVDFLLPYARKTRSVEFKDLTSLSQTVAKEPTAQCEERRQLGTQILIEKGQNVDSMLSRFVGNFIMLFSNQTTSQEVCISKCWLPECEMLF